MKNFFRIPLAILAFSLMASNANAGTVLGTVTCEQWQGSRNNPDARGAYTIWLEGYLSGANFMYGDMVDRDFIKNSDQISIVDWTDAYCDKYPKVMLKDSANALIKLLKRDMQF